MSYRKKEPIIEFLEWKLNDYLWNHFIYFFDVQNEVDTMPSEMVETLKKIINTPSFHFPFLNLDIKEGEYLVKTKYPNGEISFNVLSKKEFEDTYEDINEPLDEEDVKFLIDHYA